MLYSSDSIGDSILPINPTPLINLIIEKYLNKRNCYINTQGNKYTNFHPKFTDLSFLVSLNQNQHSQKLDIHFMQNVQNGVRFINFGPLAKKLI